MNKRLLKIASMIPFGEGFADIGTDHGFLPIYMLEQGYTGKIYASDINAGPLESAQNNAISHACFDKIAFCLADGIGWLKNMALNCIVIAGMGGELICSILDKAEWVFDPCYTLILQPMTKAEILRFWLCNNGFEIIEEQFVRDGILYPILKVTYTGINTIITDGELFVGKRKCQGSQELYLEYTQMMLSRIRRLILGKQNSKTVQKNHEELQFYLNIAGDLVEIIEGRQ